MLMLKSRREGSDVTLLNTIYHRPRKKEDGKWTKGAMSLIVKDNDTNSKFVETIENPHYEYFMANEEEYIPHNLFFIEKDKVTPISVPFVDLEKDIANRTNNLEFYFNNIKEGNRINNRKLHTHNRVFRSDMHIEDHIRFYFNKIYSNNITPLSKAYLDIEADTIDMTGDFPELGECPINAVSVIEGDTVYTLLLRNENNPLIQEFEDNLDESFITRIKETIDTTVGGYKQVIRLGLDKLDFKILFYDEEINLLIDLFKLINYKKPDFVLAWNMAFDIPYIIERIKVLGYDPIDVLCHPDFKYKECKYFIDQKADMLAERGDFYTISSYSVYLDQMVQFASRRKGQSILDSYSLDFVGKVVAKVRKLDYSDLTTDIAKFPYLDYARFVLYNIVDTIVQRCIEHKVEDIDYVFSKSIANSTRYPKVHRQTVYLANRAAMEFDEYGYIIGNNINKSNAKPAKFPGAFVADPLKISDKEKVKVNGNPINLYRNTNDFDYKRLYPSLLQESYMAPNTQIGMMYIDEKIHDFENRSNDDKFRRAGGFVEDLASGNYLEFCNRWLKLPDYKTLLKSVIWYYTHMDDSINNVLGSHDSYGNKRVIRYYVNQLRSPIVRHNEHTGISPINYRPVLPESLIKEIDLVYAKNR